MLLGDKGFQVAGSRWPPGSPQPEAALSRAHRQPGARPGAEGRPQGKGPSEWGAFTPGCSSGHRGPSRRRRGPPPAAVESRSLPTKCHRHQQKPPVAQLRETGVCVNLGPRLSVPLFLSERENSSVVTEVTGPRQRTPEVREDLDRGSQASRP